MSQELKGQEFLKAKAVKIGVSETKAGKPQVAVDLVDEKNRQWSWFGSLNEGKARDITISTLKILGFSGKLSDLASGKGIDFNKEIQITIDDRFNEDRSKSYRGVTWINELGRGAQVLAEADAVLKLAGLGLEADFASAFAPSTSPAQQSFTSDDIPF